MFADFAHVLTQEERDLTGIRLYVLDTLAVMLAGSTADSSKVMMRALVRPGGAEEATVAGVGKAASMADAALLNGAFAHALELDDDHRVAVLHPGAVVVPAALSVCEAYSATGQRFLAAVLAGYEVMCRLGLALRGSPFDHGLHPTALFGVFGAAAAAGVGMGLSAEAMTHGFGIAGTQAFGLTEWRADGSWIKRLHPGRAAQSGVLAACLAREGFTGPATILEGSGGFFRAFGHGQYIDRTGLVDALGSRFHAFETAVKPYPCCRFMHGALDLGIQAHRDGIRAEAIVSAEVRIYETGVLTYHAVPRNEVDAQFNVPYGVACALQQGAVGLGDYQLERIRDPERLALCQRIRVEVDRDYTAAYPDVYRVTLVLTLASGDTRRYESICPSGDPQAPLYAGRPEKLEQQAEAKAVSVLKQCGFGDRGSSLRRAVGQLPRASSLNELLAELRSM